MQFQREVREPSLDDVDAVGRGALLGLLLEREAVQQDLVLIVADLAVAQPLVQRCALLLGAGAPPPTVAALTYAERRDKDVTEPQLDVLGAAQPNRTQMREMASHPLQQLPLVERPVGVAARLLGVRQCRPEPLPEVLALLADPREVAHAQLVGPPQRSRQRQPSRITKGLRACS